MNKFNKAFDSYVCTDDTISATVGLYEITARIVQDGDYRIDDDDMHNVDQDVTGCNDEQQAKLLKAREAWNAGDWFYCGVVLSVSRAGVELDKHAASLWGIECNYPNSDNDYLTEVANELLDEAVDAGTAICDKLVDDRNKAGTALVIQIVFGNRVAHETHEFQTQAQLTAFREGVQAGCGNLDYDIVYTDEEL